MVRIDKPFVRRGIEHGAVVELAAVGVGIGVSIEVHQRHFTKVLGMGAQQRQGNEVVAAKGEHIERHAGDDPVRIAFIRHKVHWQTQKAKGIGYQGVIVLMT